MSDEGPRNRLTDRPGRRERCGRMKAGPGKRGDRTAAERKMSLSRPAAGGESCGAGFFLIDDEEKRRCS